MIYAERGNKVISISEDAIQRYVEQGFTIKNDTGAVIRETVPVDIPNLKKAYVEHKRLIDTLKAENTALKQQIAELQAQKTAKAVKSEPVTVVAEKSEDVAEKPKKSSKAKSE